ncbi:hypothetical protein CBS147339_6998 [Penicillium roqueforti]|uniref:Genomic scaffold, ProqFM164S04 n=1 Tax=Penicillium roqueforti (strain FM164) TaxID=1365484 RepID=W6QGZ5_PENRF|nr:hypothetical protein CBS147339_6998 [Penicillium roqueforti]KAI3102489.1 hypothetical protein CBS147338_2583 [Penicillium roqueforti]KAI3138648.1 hypothetical protein CBS147325_7021 [Penicillium roqueforti]KAI3182299.1 hypothetical protein DTO032C6_7363 [Penicillium roqueforti]CDM35226.1 unnamed protein product [Penicillium roqueforti FM164]
MSCFSRPTSSPQQPGSPTSHLPEADHDEINKSLRPIQVSAANIPTAVRVYSTIQSLIQRERINTPDLLVITQLKPHVGTQLWQKFEQLESRALRKSFDPNTGTFMIKMPTPLHNCALIWFQDARDKWIEAGLLTTAEKRMMKAQVADTITLTRGVYANCRKEPDVHVNVHGLNLPTLCFEIGYSESKPLLESDMRRLLIGGQGEITAVILIKWFKRRAGVAGTIELWRLDNNGNPLKEQAEAIFPVPSSPQPPIKVTRKMLFGNALLPGRPPLDIFSFSLDDLRMEAQIAMAKQSLFPL